MKKWELKVSSDQVKAFFKKGGNNFFSDMPYIMIEMLFSSQIPMEHLVEAIYSPEHRQKWDKNLLTQEKTPMSISRCYTDYIMLTSPMNLPCRDFFNKCIEFSHEGNFYCYESNILNDHLNYPPPEDVERGKVIISMQKIERRQEDGKILFTWLLQYKVKKVPFKLMPMGPPQIMEWSHKLNKYLKENFSNNTQ